MFHPPVWNDQLTTGLNKEPHNWKYRGENIRMIRPVLLLHLVAGMLCERSKFPQYLETLSL